MYQLHKEVNRNLQPLACPEVNKGQRMDGSGTADCKLSCVEHFSLTFIQDKYDLNQSIIHENRTASFFTSKIL